MVDSGAHYKDALRRGLPLHLDAGYLDAVHDQVLPYRRIPCFPLHGSIGVCEYPFEPAFIRKRNERERHRVRCVNEGYARLREHLPQEFDDRRLSKVETLRAAIDYIKHLQSLLDINVSSRMDVMPLGEARSRAPLPHRVYNSDGESKTGLIALSLEEHPREPSFYCLYVSVFMFPTSADLQGSLMFSDFR
uniref:Achaete-scute family bHLH transcription factor 4 n=1 Tax=Cynoglossus semilaevis TaxID=244447 RepID=A0A3P8VS12_CYNSE